MGDTSIYLEIPSDLETSWPRRLADNGLRIVELPPAGERAKKPGLRISESDLDKDALCVKCSDPALNATATVSSEYRDSFQRQILSIHDSRGISAGVSDLRELESRIVSILTKYGARPLDVHSHFK